VASAFLKTPVAQFALKGTGCTPALWTTVKKHTIFKSTAFFIGYAKGMHYLYDVIIQ
jgi:hypothetical protein